MGRVLAIDYGTKRVGVAVTDPLRIIATPLAVVRTADVLVFLQTYIAKEEVDTLVIGVPKHLNNTPSPMTAIVTRFIKTLQKNFLGMRIVQQDERFTSKIVASSMLEGGFKKKDRRDKANLDQLSAVIILQSFLASCQAYGRS
ncbi:MAG: Holliday junction resolvase RuvX [Amoebophilaceae bacterium]|jgi:putative Holliday junction resolvase|nr:Holliday junction resolvase RuvX [Amoebophilaceae bacterium]